MNQRKVSAHFYAFEDLLWKCPSFAELRKRRPIRELRYLAAEVWLKESGSGPVPQIRFKGRNDFSEYVYDDRSIVLIRRHQNLGGLLHEIAHALGPHDKYTHGPAFSKRCIHLYKVYGGWSGVVD